MQRGACSCKEGGKSRFYSVQLVGCEKDQKQLHRIVNSLTWGDSRSKLPLCSSTRQLMENFNAFFLEKVAKIQNTFLDAEHLQRLTFFTAVHVIAHWTSFLHPAWRSWQTSSGRCQRNVAAWIQSQPVCSETIWKVCFQTYFVLCVALCNPASSLQHSRLCCSRHSSRGLA